MAETKSRTREEILKLLNETKPYTSGNVTIQRNVILGAERSALQAELRGSQTQKQSDLEAEAKAAVEEAKAKQEASKKSALGYYDKAAGDIATSKTAAQGFYQPFADEIAGMDRELIDPAMREEMEATRRTQLGAYGQNLAGMYGDAGSGVQSGKRAEIGMGIAGMQADLPIELQLEIAEKNRQSQLGVIGAGMNVAGAQAGVEGQYAGLGLGVASGKAGIETAYQYDPGLEFIKSLGYNQGYQNTLGASSGGGTTTTTTMGSAAPSGGGGTTAIDRFQQRSGGGFGTGLKKMGVDPKTKKFVQLGTW